MDETGIGGPRRPKVRTERGDATIGKVRLRQNPRVHRGVSESKRLVVQSIHVGHPDGKLRTWRKSFAHTPERKEQSPQAQFWSKRQEQRPRPAKRS